MGLSCSSWRDGAVTTSIGIGCCSLPWSTQSRSSANPGLGRLPHLTPDLGPGAGPGLPLHHPRKGFRRDPHRRATPAGPAPLALAGAVIGGSATNLEGLQKKGARHGIPEPPTEPCSASPSFTTLRRGSQLVTGLPSGLQSLGTRRSLLGRLAELPVGSQILRAAPGSHQRVLEFSGASQSFGSPHRIYRRLVKPGNTSQSFETRRRTFQSPAQSSSGSQIP